MGFFSGLIDTITDIGSAVAPVVSVFNPAIGAGLTAAQNLDETLNPDEQAAALQFEGAMEQAALLFAQDQLAINQEMEQDGEEYIEEAVNGS